MHLILTILLLITACNEQETQRQESILFGNWKLISFVNQSTNTIISENDFLNSNQITITFNKELNFNGNTIINNFAGAYFINESNKLITFLNFSTTEVNETAWGELFYQSLNSNYIRQTRNWENTYDITQENILKIFYSEQEYMTLEKL
tara:strand:- start:78 stop:524 length:447 start_codon:yes stop_codon:yes gene_type:complete